MMIIMNDEWQVLPDKARGGARGRLSVLRHERFQMWTTIVTILIMRIVTIIVTILIVFFCEQGSHPPVLPIQQPPNHHNKNPRWEVGWIFWFWFWNISFGHEIRTVTRRGGRLSRSSASVSPTSPNQLSQIMIHNTNSFTENQHRLHTGIFAFDASNLWLSRLHLVEGVGRISLALATLTEDPGEEERIDEGKQFFSRRHQRWTSCCSAMQCKDQKR